MKIIHHRNFILPWVLPGLCLLLLITLPACNMPGAIEVQFGLQDEEEEPTEEIPVTGYEATQEAAAEHWFATQTADAEARGPGNEVSSGFLGNPEEPTQVPGEPSGGVTCPAGEFRIQVYKNETPKESWPDFIAYANPEAAPSPAGVTITYSPDFVAQDEWRIAQGSSAWIQAASTLRACSISVVFSREGTQGGARIFLDGNEVWNGDTSGQFGDGGGMYLSVELAGLAPTPHIIRVQPSGSPGSGGGTQVSVWYFGYSVAR